MKIILIFPLLIVSSLFSNELSWVDEQVNAIKPNRNGTSDKSISKLKNPFVYLKKNTPKKDKPTKKLSTKSNSVASLVSNTNSDVNINDDINNIQKVTTPNTILTLSAIINSSALINGSWYKLDEKIHNYKITKITKTSVSLIKNKKTTVLSTKSNASKLKFK